MSGALDLKKNLPFLRYMDSSLITRLIVPSVTNRFRLCKIICDKQVLRVEYGNSSHASVITRLIPRLRRRIESALNGSEHESYKHYHNYSRPIWDGKAVCCKNASAFIAAFSVSYENESSRPSGLYIFWGTEYISEPQ